MLNSRSLLFKEFYNFLLHLSLVQFSSITQSCSTLCNPMNCSMPGFLVHHQLLELLKFMSIALVMPPNHLFLCCPPSRVQSFSASGSFPVSCFFASGGQGIGVSASVLPMNSQGWFPFGLTGLISFQSKGLRRVFSSITVWKHWFFCTQPLWSNSHILLWLVEKP